MANEPASDDPDGRDGAPRLDKRTRFAAGPAPVPVPRTPARPPPPPTTDSGRIRTTMVDTGPSPQTGLTVTPPSARPAQTGLTMPPPSAPAQTGRTMPPPGTSSAQTMPPLGADSGPIRTGATVAPPGARESGPIRTGATVAPPSAEPTPARRPKTAPNVRRQPPLPSPNDPILGGSALGDPSAPLWTEDDAPPAKRKRATAPAVIHRGVVPPEPPTGVTAEIAAATAAPEPDLEPPPPPSASTSSSNVAHADTQFFGEAAPPAGAVRRDRATRALSRDTAGGGLHGMEGLSEPGADSPRIRLTPGRQIPGTRWRIDRWLGEGGMGVVYEASHVDIERKSALKILRFDLSQQERMVQVFRDEARAASRLGSPHIVEIFDFGELADGRLFFSMELLEGQDLVPLEEGVAMAPGRLIGIMRQVCKGLSVAHDAAVIHRDVKPENIILVDHEGRTDFVKLVDFGISSMLAAGQEGTGGIAGTPHYMAPEQIVGDRFDARLDVYAVGCTAYELLVGRPPFDDEDIEALLHKQINDQPVAPRTVRPELTIPAALETVILRCLAKAPDNRYPNMIELEAALCEAQIAAGLTTPWDDLALPQLADAERLARIKAKMPSARVERPRRSLVWPIVAGVSTMAAAGLAAFLILGGPTDQDKELVDRIAAEARDAAVRADWVYPPPTEPDAPTAFRKVLELENLDGSADGLGDDRAGDLRVEFADALDRYGDRAWDEGSKTQAREFYMWALTFNENDGHALDRLDMSPVFVAEFRRKAEAGDFSEQELLLGRMAGVETIEDESAKAQEQEKVVAAAAESEALDSAMLAERGGMGNAAEKVLQRRRERTAKRGEGVVDASPTPDEEVDDDVPEIDADIEELLEAAEIEETDPTGKTGKTGSRSKKKHRRKTEALLGSAERDPARASELVAEGEQAYAAGHRSKAASLFNQAIAFDRGNTTALMGLSDIYFDQGKNQKAVVYAERAVKASPSNKNYRIKLGDAYFKVLRYKDALTQYEKAKALGATKAQARIDRVNSKLGH